MLMVLEAGFEPAAHARKNDLTQDLTQIASPFGYLPEPADFGRRGGDGIAWIVRALVRSWLYRSVMASLVCPTIPRSAWRDTPTGKPSRVMNEK